MDPKILTRAPKRGEKGDFGRISAHGPPSGLPLGVIVAPFGAILDPFPMVSGVILVVFCIIEKHLDAQWMHFVAQGSHLLLDALQSYTHA